MVKNTKNKQTVEFRKSTLFIAGIVIVAALVLAFALNGGSNSDRDIDGKVAEESQIQEAQTSSVLSEGDPVLGDKNAKITVVEFSDFECPYCKRAYDSTISGLKDSQMFEEGSVNFVYKHFPLRRIHPDAQKAAEASECANRQGMFWEYHDKIFQNQDSLSVGSLKQYAEDIDLDTEEFNSCLDNGEAETKVENDLQVGKNAGARGTPYFVIINRDTGETQSVSGAIPWTQLKSAIQQVS